MIPITKHSAQISFSLPHNKLSIQKTTRIYIYCPINLVSIFIDIVVKRENGKIYRYKKKKKNPKLFFLNFENRNNKKNYSWKGYQREKIATCCFHIFSTFEWNGIIEYMNIGIFGFLCWGWEKLSVGLGGWNKIHSVLHFDRI